MITINEREYLNVAVTVLDENNVQAIPRVVRYRLDCDSTGRSIIGWTDVTPSATFTVTIPSSANAIQSGSNSVEVKTLTIDTNYDGDDRVPASYSWSVRNLAYI